MMHTDSVYVAGCYANNMYQHNEVESFIEALSYNMIYQLHKTFKIHLVKNWKIAHLAQMKIYVLELFSIKNLPQCVMCMTTACVLIFTLVFP